MIRPLNTGESRREMLQRAGLGFGSLALSALLGDRIVGGEPIGNVDGGAGGRSPLAPRRPHHTPAADNVIFLFIEGGPSHIDLFDPKPLLNELAGKPLPSSFKPVITAMGESNAPLLASKRKWKQHGEGGLWISDWLPEIATCADDLAVIRGCWSNGINHSGGVCQMNTGQTVGGRPSLGAWVSYGLGSENEDLPAFVVMEDQKGRVVNGPRNWSAGFMPALYEGTPLLAGPEPIPNLNPPAGLTASRQRAKLDLLAQINARHAAPREHQTELEARIQAHELAFRMQASAPEAVDLSQETAETQQLYGLGGKETGSFGRLCLLSRRLVERGVRFVQLYHGAGSRWDAHSNIEGNHSKLCREMDKPVAGLLKDLKRRGLLERTLVVWGGEFGRTPMSEKGNGRDHNPYGFTMWMAGGGVRGGRTIGATDEVGLHAIEQRAHIHDLHSTILNQLGLHHMQLIYQHKGRPERPTLNEGHPLKLG